MGIFDHFKPQAVVVVRSPGTADEERVDTRAIVTPEMITFEVTEKVYEGDLIEVADPRGGVIRHRVKKIDILQSPFNSNLDHIEAFV